MTDYLRATVHATMQFHLFAPTDITTDIRCPFHPELGIGSWVPVQPLAHPLVLTTGSFACRTMTAPLVNRPQLGGVAPLFCCFPVVFCDFETNCDPEFDYHSLRCGLMLCQATAALNPPTLPASPLPPVSPTPPLGPVLLH